MRNLNTTVFGRIRILREKCTNMRVINIPEDGNKDQKITQTRTEVGEYMKRLEPLYEVAQNASTASEVSKPLEEILCITKQIVGASASSFLLIDDDMMI